MLQARVPLLRPHQILAVNRGEAHGFLSVKLECQQFEELVRRCFKAVVKSKGLSPAYRQLVQEAVEDGFKRRVVVHPVGVVTLILQLSHGRVLT